MGQFGLVMLTGLSWGMTVFLTAAGLTLVFGILHILNFAHGGFVMLGAYLAYSMLSYAGAPSLWAFIAATLGSALVLGLLGALLDRIVFRRLRGVNQSYSLIATYALLLLCQGAVKIVWGINFLSVPPPPDLAGGTDRLGGFAPNFILFVVGCGVAVFLALEYLVHRTELGKTVQSVAADPWMASLLGVNVRAVLTGTVVAGIALGGMAGGLLSINQSLSPNMGGALIIQAFGVIVVGGMGSIRGAFMAAVALGLITALGDHFFTEIPGLFFYVALAAILLWRPQGLVKGIHR
jgi:branched-chain amino acid transport system permease protein